MWHSVREQQLAVIELMATVIGDDGWTLGSEVVDRFVAEDEDVGLLELVAGLGNLCKMLLNRLEQNEPFNMTKKEYLLRVAAQTALVDDGD